MDFENLAKSWDSFGVKDPLWAVLTWEGKKDNHWDPAEFFEIGEGSVRNLMEEVEKWHTIDPASTALDFGCGVGRLTFPLARVSPRFTGSIFPRRCSTTPGGFRRNGGSEIASSITMSDPT